MLWHLCFVYFMDVVERRCSIFYYEGERHGLWCEHNDAFGYSSGDSSGLTEVQPTLLSSKDWLQATPSRSFQKADSIPNYVKMNLQ